MDTTGFQKRCLVNAKCRIGSEQRCTPVTIQLHQSQPLEARAALSKHQPHFPNTPMAALLCCSPPRCLLRNAQDTPDIDIDLHLTPHWQQELVGALHITDTGQPVYRDGRLLHWLQAEAADAHVGRMRTALIQHPDAACKSWLRTVAAQGFVEGPGGVCDVPRHCRLAVLEASEEVVCADVRRAVLGCQAAGPADPRRPRRINYANFYTITNGVQVTGAGALTSVRPLLQHLRDTASTERLLVSSSLPAWQWRRLRDALPGVPVGLAPPSAPSSDPFDAEVLLRAASEGQAYVVHSTDPLLTVHSVRRTFAEKAALITRRSAALMVVHVSDLVPLQALSASTTIVPGPPRRLVVTPQPFLEV